MRAAQPSPRAVGARATDGLVQGQLHHTSLKDQALAVLRQGIITGGVAPGEIYSAASLAAALGVSASPVRDAMLALVHEGVMQPVRNRGFRLVPLSDEDMQNIYELRVDLEIPAMVRLARSGLAAAHDARFRRIARGIVDAANASDLVAFLALDREFHLGLLARQGNNHLVDIVASLRDRTRLRGLPALATGGQLVESAEEHERILDAVVLGNAERTQELMLAHLQHIVTEWAADSNDALRDTTGASVQAAFPERTG